MKKFPVFLLPQGEIMMTAIIENGSIKLLKSTLFPSHKQYAISTSGMAACLVADKKLIIYGQMNEDGDFEYVKILPFPSMMRPRSIGIINNNIILGGINFQEDDDIIEIDTSYMLVVSYSISKDKFTPVDLPFEHSAKCIDDLLVDGNHVIVVDSTSYPKYIVEYNINNPDYPKLVQLHNLPENYSFETFKKGTQNDVYIAIISTFIGLRGSGQCIQIFKKGDYRNYIQLSQGDSIDNKEDGQKRKFFYDIFLVPDQDFLLIAYGKDGIGIYYIENSFLKEDEDDNENVDSIIYLNNWGKKVMKILPLPNDNDNIILFFEEVHEKNTLHTYSIENINDLIETSQVREFEEKEQEFWDSNFEPYNNDYGDSGYCEACQSSPCMCSDRERTSTTYDY